MTTPETTSWTVHLAAHRPGRAVVTVIIIIFALFGVAALVPPQWDTASKVMMLLLAGVLLFSSVAEFLLPITYTLDGEGAHARILFTHRVLAWNRVRRVYLERNGIKLSPLAARNWIESYRGVYLRTPLRDAILAQVCAWLESAGVTPTISEES